MKRTAPAPAAVAAAVLALLAGPALAQSTAPSDNVTTLLGLFGVPHPAANLNPEPFASAAALELKGETNGPAPDSEQNPVEVSITQRLNAQVAERNELADQTDRANAAAHSSAVHEYKEEKADVAGRDRASDRSTRRSTPSRAPNTAPTRRPATRRPWPTGAPPSRPATGATPPAATPDRCRPGPGTEARAHGRD
jgi:hypothetical protein